LNIPVHLFVIYLVYNIEDIIFLPLLTDKSYTTKQKGCNIQVLIAMCPELVSGDDNAVLSRIDSPGAVNFHLYLALTHFYYYLPFNFDNCLPFIVTNQNLVNLEYTLEYTKYVVTSTFIFIQIL